MLALMFTMQLPLYRAGTMFNDGTDGGVIKFQLQKRCLLNGNSIDSSFGPNWKGHVYKLFS